MNPVQAWKEIDKAEFSSPLYLIRNILGFFLIINPVLYFLTSLVFFESFKALILDGMVYPLTLILLSYIALIFLGLLLEEIYRIVSFKDPQLNIFKLLVFSSLPLYSLSGFYHIPVAGKILFITGFFYSAYVLKIGFEKFLWTNKSAKRNVFLISSILSIVILFLVTTLFITILNTIRILLIRLIF